MSNADEQAEIRLARDDLTVVAESIALRLQLRHPEAQRCRRIRELTTTSSGLAQAMAVYAQRASVVCENRRAAEDVVAETELLYEKLLAFAAIIESIASEFRPLIERTDGSGMVAMRAELGPDIPAQR